MKQRHDSLDNPKRPSLANPRVLTAAALLTAVSFVLAYLAKSIFGPGVIRVTFECLPVFFGSMVFGPAIGVGIAVAADLLSCLQASMTPNLIVAAGAAVLGGLSGILFRYLPSRVKIKTRILLSVTLSHLVGSMLIKSAGLYLYFGWAILWRIPVYLGIAAAETLLLQYLMTSDALMRQIGKVMQK